MFVNFFLPWDTFGSQRVGPETPSTEPEDARMVLSHPSLQRDSKRRLEGRGSAKAHQQLTESCQPSERNRGVV